MGHVYIISKKKSYTINNEPLDIYETVSITTSPTIAESIMKERSDYYFFVKSHDIQLDKIKKSV